MEKLFDHTEKQENSGKYLTLLIGPPRNPDQDAEVVRILVESPGVKAVCGGTTGKITARELNLPLEVDLISKHDKIPPMGIIEGIDLVTEGVLTITAVLELLKQTTPTTAEGDMRDGECQGDGASQLAAALTQADTIHLIIGTAENKAMYQGLSPERRICKERLLQNLIDFLSQDKSKTVRVDYY